MSPHFKHKQSTELLLRVYCLIVAVAVADGDLADDELHVLAITATAGTKAKAEAAQAEAVSQVKTQLGLEILLRIMETFSHKEAFPVKSKTFFSKDMD